MGLDCIYPVITYILNNMNIFKDYTVYAHNGNKLDYVLMMNERIMNENCKRIIDKHSLIDLNTSIIGFTLLKSKDKKRKFKDSIKVLLAD